MPEKMFRHTFGARFMHWFNAAAWFFLLATGLGLIQNPDLQPLGAWWPATLRSLFGGGGNLLAAHWGLGLVWAGVWLVFLVATARVHALPFLRQIFSYSPRRDLEWLVKKNFQMTLGYRAMARLVKPLGWDGRIPAQGFYNAGQKVAAVGLVAGALALLASGLVMTASKYYLAAGAVSLVQWSILLHFVAAGVTFGLLLVHIYMAAISPEERPAFFSMFTGVVPADYAQHHHQLWYDEVKAGKA
ncbi:MAG: cytochrome b/b6 domain-containing protein [Deltaproteobacteria bacterium]|nr:cytochrome b/b6 domain-containing protein [Deltaproteobacteria bacterium]